MLHPKLQAQISECLDKKTDADNITRLFRKISEAYYAYEEELKQYDTVSIPEIVDVHSF